MQSALKKIHTIAERLKRHLLDGFNPYNDCHVSIHNGTDGSLEWVG